MCRRYLVAFFLIFLPSLHAQTPSTTDTDKATVYFYRLRDNYAALLKPSVYCDKNQVARMRNGRFVSTTFPAGEHTITSTFTGNGLVINLRPGETYYFRLQMVHASLIHNARGEVTAVIPEQGKFEVSQLKPAEPEDLKVEETTASTK